MRVASKQELKDRIMAYLDDINRDPVVHKWTYRLDAQKCRMRGASWKRCTSLLMVRVRYGFLARHGFNAACGMVRQPLYHNLPVMR